MNRIITIIFCIMIYQYSFSQAHRIVYRAEFTLPKIGENLKGIPDKFKEKIKNLKKNNDNVYCFLDFEKNKSVFYIDNKMEVNIGKRINMTRVKIGKGVFFVDNNKSEIINQKESFGNLFEVIHPNNKWVITQLTKKVGKFICYKATTDIVKKGRWGNKKIQVIAWFTTSLPYRFGPKQYSGLPGVILELTEGNLTFYAQKIKLNQVLLKLKKAKEKNQRVTKEEFDNIGKKAFENR